MASEPKVTDISDYPELLRLVEEIQADDAPRVLRSGGQELAVIVPFHRSEGTGSRTTAEQDATFYSSFGALRGLIDAEQLKRDIRESRGSDRPTYEL